MAAVMLLKQERCEDVANAVLKRFENLGPKP